MADLVARRGAFAHLSREQVNRRVIDSARVIKKHAKIAVAASCTEDESRETIRVLPDGIAKQMGISTPYSICGFAAISAVQIINDRLGRDDEFAYVFEAGTKGHGDLQRLLEKLMRNGGFRDYYRIASYAFEGKDPRSPLGAADMFAWEWNLEHSRSGADHRRSTRESFMQILNGVRHRAYTGGAGKMLLEAIQEAKSDMRLRE